MFINFYGYGGSIGGSCYVSIKSSDPLWLNLSTDVLAFGTDFY